MSEITLGAGSRNMTRYKENTGTVLKTALVWNVSVALIKELSEGLRDSTAVWLIAEETKTLPRLRQKTHTPTLAFKTGKQEKRS